MGIVYRPLELPSREGELKTFPTKREVGKIIIFNSAGDEIDDMWSFPER